MSITAIEEIRVQETIKDTVGDIPQQDGKRGRSADHAPSPREGVEARTEIYEERQPVRR